VIWEAELIAQHWQTGNLSVNNESDVSGITKRNVGFRVVAKDD